MKIYHRNFGFMFTILLSLFLLCSLTFAQEAGIPSVPLGYVSDFAHLLGVAEKKALEDLSLELEQKTTAQLAVVTVNTTSPESIEPYTVRLFEKWGIGHKGKDNGVLLLVAYQDRAVRIEVGYGLEGVLTDAICKNIIEKFIIPSFKQGQFSQGIYKGSLSIANSIAESYNVALSSQNYGMDSTVFHQLKGAQPEVFDSSTYFIDSISGFILIFGIFVIFLILFTAILFRGGRRRWYRYDDYYGSGLGGGFSGGFGGGFGGFGGGSSGGGGATGRW